MKKAKKVSCSPLILIPTCYHYLLVALLAGIVYSNTLRADFVYDDRPAILSNDDVLGRSPWSSLVTTNDFWGNPIRLEGSHKSYRPLITASFRLQFEWHGLKSELFHGVNLICHIFNSMLVLKLARQMKVIREEFSLFSSLLFACHPITSEAVCSIVGRADLLTTTFILLALTSHITRSNTIRTIFLAVLAVLSKETGIILIPLVVTYDVLFKNPSTKQFRQDITNHFIALSIICYLRLSINNIQSPKFSKNDNPIAHDPNFFTRALTFLYLPIFHLKLIVFPKTLSFDWSMDAIPKVESILDSRFILAAIFYTIGAKMIWELFFERPQDRNSEDYKKNNSVLFLLGFLTIPHILSSNLFTYVGFVAAERILYLNTVAYCILVGYGVDVVCRRFPTTNPIPLLTLLLSIFSYRTIQRVDDWKTEESLFSSALEVNPTKAHMNLGFVFTTQKNFDLAKFHYQQALRKRANLADAWYNLGILTSKTNSTQEAIHYYQKALQSRSNFAAAHLNVALLLHDTNQLQKAFFHLDSCIQNSGDTLKSYRNHRKTQATCAYNKGRFLQKSGHFHVAIENFKLALEIIDGAHFEHTSSVLSSLGTCYNELGDVASAERYFQMAISENHVNSFLTMAHLKIRQNQSYEVERLLQKAMTLAPESVTVLQNIALAEYHMHNYNRSLLFYRKALSLNPSHVESLQGIANLLQESQNYAESELFYRKVMEILPDSYSSHANYGAILHLNQKYEQALKAYDTALLLNPNDDVARENRQKVMRILRRKRNL
ncbi:hypothetical protein L3Y34_006468 [Caenorhabditis briggsae]|uniref:dolichyl-phosphate-mannose--protein mannosyltransferase n=1 Tax=Caenorhabditis briggsae TaxID=6238 RepID=A0AAE9CXX6_CAEBR|nr:hypothetical protein L3Y34_006468 [Caenorhabditis briggsae]